MDSGNTSASARAARRAAYARSTGFGMLVGAVAGIGAGVLVGGRGYPGDIPFFAVMYACLGVAASAVLAGLAAAVSLIARPSTPTRRSAAVATTVGVGAAGISTLVPTAGPPVVVAVLGGIAAAAIGYALARVAERRAHREPMRQVLRDATVRRPMAAIAVLVGGALALPLGAGLVTLLREQLRYACSGGAPGTEAAGWICADGISYLGAGLPPLGAALVVVVGGVVLILTSTDLRPVRIGLVALAAVAVGVGLTGTWLAVAQETREVPPGVVRTDFWLSAVLPAALVIALALAVAVVALATRGLIAVVLTALAAGGMLVATVVQPGLALSTMPALGLLAAAAVVIDPRRPPRKTSSDRPS